MKLSIEIARHFGEILSPEEMDIKFKQEDDGVITRLYSISIHKHCPICGNLVDVRFYESMCFRNADCQTSFPCWIETTSNCDKCHNTFGVAVRINKGGRKCQ